MTKAKAQVEMIPFGVSEIDRAGIPFVDSTAKDGTVTRSRANPPTPGTVKTVSWKCESFDPLCGPVWLDGVPVAEQAFHEKGETAEELADHSWSTAWYTRTVAQRMAKNLGAEFADA
jgi:hypothetical protein